MSSNTHQKEPGDEFAGTDQPRGGCRRRSAIRALIQDFTPIWFTWCMNSGALAQLLHQCPYHFRGVDVIADIFFVVDFILYLTFSSLFVARLLWFRQSAYQEIISDMAQLTFVPCWSISFMTLASGIGLIVSNSSWGGYAFSVLAYVMFWIAQTWDMVLLFWAFVIMIRHHSVWRDRRIPASIIIPAVSVATTATTGAVVATFSHGLSAELAVPIMIVSFNWAGVGILLALILYAYLFHALLTEGWPLPDQSPTMFILVGPMGQSAAALQILGLAASTYQRFGDFERGVFLTTEAAKSLNTTCTLVALLLNGLGVIWLGFGICCMLERAWQRKLKWTPAWNAIVFPNATLTTSFLLFAIEMDSPAYRVIAAGMIICLVIFYLMNLAFTLLRIWEGRLLVVRQDWRQTEDLLHRPKEQ